MIQVNNDEISRTINKEVRLKTEEGDVVHL